MEHEFWRRRWKKQEIAFHQASINGPLRRYWLKIAEKPCRVFVPLCGKSMDMNWLAGQGHQVLGVELSRSAVSDFFGEENLTPQVEKRGQFEIWSAAGIEIMVGDFFSLEKQQLDDVGAVFDRASLIAFPPEMRGVYVAHLNRILPSGVKTLLVTLDYPQQEMSGPPFSVTPEEVQLLYGGQWQVELLENNEVLSKIKRFQDAGLSRLSEPVLLLSPEQ